MDDSQYNGTHIEPIEIVIDELEGSRGTHRNVLVIIEEVSLREIRFLANVELALDERVVFHLPSINVASLVSGRITCKQVMRQGGYKYALEF